MLLLDLFIWWIVVVIVMGWGYVVFMVLYGDRDDELWFFQIGEYFCGYWFDWVVCDLVLDLNDCCFGVFYLLVLSWGFCCSGDLVYWFYCVYCQVCVVVCILVVCFVLDCSQCCCVVCNVDLEVWIIVVIVCDDLFVLYYCYFIYCYVNGGMDDYGLYEFEQFLIGSWLYICFMEMCLFGYDGQFSQLLGVVVIDVIEYGLLVVYMFFDLDYVVCGLGIFVIF